MLDGAAVEHGPFSAKAYPSQEVICNQKSLKSVLFAQDYDGIMRLLPTRDRQAVQVKPTGPRVTPSTTAILESATICLNRDHNPVRCRSGRDQLPGLGQLLINYLATVWPITIGLIVVKRPDLIAERLPCNSGREGTDARPSSSRWVGKCVEPRNEATFGDPRHKDAGASLLVAHAPASGGFASNPLPIAHRFFAAPKSAGDDSAYGVNWRL